MTETYVRQQLEVKRAEWKKRYDSFKIEVNTQSESPTFERNLMQGLITMMLLRDEILELEQILIRIEIEENCGE